LKKILLVVCVLAAVLAGTVAVVYMVSPNWLVIWRIERLDRKLTGEPLHDAKIGLKQDDLRSVLLKRGYLVEQEFVAGHVYPNTSKCERFKKDLRGFLRERCGPVAAFKVSSVGDSAQKASVTVRDIPSRLPLWRDVIALLDKMAQGPK
jgi:hypothetical protein